MISNVNNIYKVIFFVEAFSMHISTKLDNVQVRIRYLTNGKLLLEKKLYKLRLSKLHVDVTKLHQNII